MNASSKYIFLLTASLCIVVLSNSYAHAGDFKVSPVKVFFDARERTSSIEVVNLGGEKATIQIYAMKWSQNEEGEDIYEDTNDIVIFPQIATIETDHKRVIRLGFQPKEPLTVEGTYRIFIEELPVRKPGEKTLRISLRMNIPVFISPIQKITDTSIESVGMDGGQLYVKVRNNGNVHFLVRRLVITGIDEAGLKVFSKELSGWYALSGASRTYVLELNAEECAKADKVRVVLEAKKSSMRSDLDVDRAMCALRNSTGSDTQHREP